MLFADKMVYLTKQYKEEVAQKLKWLYKPTASLVIPNGIDLNVFKPVKKTEIPVITLGMQSRFIDIKDHKTLLRAFSLVCKKMGPYSLILYIEGDGQCRNELERLA